MPSAGCLLALHKYLRPVAGRSVFPALVSIAAFLPPTG